MTDAADACAYCGKLPIAPPNVWTCGECVFNCDTCGVETPFELGVAESATCDVCAVV